MSVSGFAVGGLSRRRREKVGFVWQDLKIEITYLYVIDRDFDIKPIARLYSYYLSFEYPAS